MPRPGHPRLIGQVVPNVAGVPVVGDGVYEFLLPHQRSAADGFWIDILRWTPSPTLHGRHTHHPWEPIS